MVRRVCAAAVVCLLFAAGASAARPAGYLVYWTPPCPAGFLCKLHTTFAANYGQALKTERVLAAAGDRIVSVVKLNG